MLDRDCTGTVHSSTPHTVVLSMLQHSAMYPYATAGLQHSSSIVLVLVDSIDVAIHTSMIRWLPSSIAIAHCMILILLLRVHLSLTPHSTCVTVLRIPQDEAQDEMRRDAITVTYAGVCRRIA